MALNIMMILYAVHYFYYVVSRSSAADAFLKHSKIMYSQPLLGKQALYSLNEKEIKFHLTNGSS